MKKYDVVHIHMLSASNMIPLKIAKKLGVSKRIAHAHSTRAEGLLRSVMHNIYYKKISKFSNILFACSENAGMWMFGENAKYVVIKNAIDLEKFAFDNEKREKIREKLGIKKEDILYGNIGTLNIAKNQQFLIKVFNEIIKKQTNSSLCIVGTGEFERNLKELTESLKISDRVLFLGKRLDVDEIYSALDCIIMPSLYEGLPITLVEAQANGLKCYVSKDNVPSESKIISSLEFISLNDGEKVWAEKIVDSNIERESDATEMLREKHFDIKREIDVLMEIYCK